MKKYYTRKDLQEIFFLEKRQVYYYLEKLYKDGKVFHSDTSYIIDDDVLKELEKLIKEKKYK